MPIPSVWPRDTETPNQKHLEQLAPLTSGEDLTPSLLSPSTEQLANLPAS